MDNQQQTHSTGAITPEAGAPLPFVRNGRRRARKELDSAFAKNRPLALLISERESAASSVIQEFVDDIKGNVAIARVPAANSNAIAGMREITRAIGFDPKHMSVSEMENVFKMFLSYQKAHNRRTIVCVEEAPDQQQWALDRVQQLVELETEGQYGLMVILSGRPALSESLREHPLNELAARAAEQISIEPRMVDETQAPVRRQSPPEEDSDVEGLSETQVSRLLHRLRHRVPDAAKKIYVKYFDLHPSNPEKSEAATDGVLAEGETQILRTNIDVSAAKEKQSEPVHAEDVSEPETQQRRKPRARLSAAAARKIKENKGNPVIGRLVVHMDDEIVQAEVLKRDNVLIGRSKMCDLRLLSQKVSRHHAMVVNSANGTELVDLRSTNGTAVDGRPVQHHLLQDNDAISIDDYLIRYIAND